MSNQSAFDVVSVRKAIERVGASASAVAHELGCTRGTVYAYLRKYPELKEAFERVKGGAVADKSQFTREAFISAIKESRGVKAGVASALGCSRQTVDNALERWPDLAEMLESARGGLVASAVGALARDVENVESDGHQRAYMFVLKTLGKDDGFTERTEHTGANGAGLLDLSPEVVKLVQSMGLDMSEVVRQFEGMVRAVAVERGMRE